MPIYMLATRIDPHALTGPHALEALEKQVTAKIQSELPDVRWLANYALLGQYDYMDVFEAPDNDTAGRVSLIIRSFGHATTEVWPAIRWKHFEGLVGTAGQSSPAE
jgi:uncharacterized protein with GYD domain